MSNLGKIASLIVIIACAASLYLGNKIKTEKVEHLNKIAELDGKLTTTTAKLTDTQTKLTNKEAVLKDTQAKLEDTNQKLDAKGIELADKTKEADGLKTQVADLTKVAEDSKTALATAQGEMQKIRDGLKEAGFEKVEDIAEVKKKIVGLADENKVLTDGLAKSREENKVLTAKVVELSTTPVGLRGKVAVAENKWNFVILDVGHDQKVQPATQFLVYRDNKMVAKVQVVTVGPTTSVAEVLPEFRKGSPQAGDLAVH